MPAILAELHTLYLMKLIGKYLFHFMSHLRFTILIVKNILTITYAYLILIQRMLDMGFEEDVRYIISQCKDKESRQTAMFSATWPAAIQNLAMEFMVDPVCIYVGFESIVGSNGENAVDDSLSANKRVSQTVEVIEDRAREPRLRELLGKYSKGKKKNDRILIFALYKKEAARLEGTVNRWGYSCASIHGDKSQDARERALAEFKDGSCPILVATDVAARGEFAVTDYFALKSIAVLTMVLLHGKRSRYP